MSEAAAFFLGSGPDVARYDCLEIYHPNFSQTYRIVRNAPAGLVVAHDGTPITEWIFDGVTDRIEMGGVLGFERTDAFSVSAWINTTDAGGRIVAKSAFGGNGRGWAVAIAAPADPGTPGSVVIRLTNDRVSSDEIEVYTVDTVHDGQDHAVLVTYDGSSGASGVTIYVDGVSKSLNVVEDGLSGTIITATELEINHSGNGLAGKIYEVAVFDSELSSGDASDLYGGGAPPEVTGLACATDLVAYWKLDGGDSTGSNGVLDRSGSGFHGTATFDPTVTTEAEFSYDYYPARVVPIASEDDLVQSLGITLGDVGDVIAAELKNIWSANGLNTRPSLTYRAYRSDDLSAPIEGSERVLEIAAVSRTREGCSFEARAPELNASRTGELYTVERFPMLAGFL